MASEVYEITIELKPVEGGSADAGTGADPTGAGGGALPPSTDDPDADKEVAAASSKSVANPAKAIVAKMIKQVATTALSNYGNITGDYTTQENLQTVVGEVTAIAGAVAMGPAGIAMYAVDKVVQVFNYISNLKRAEAESAFKQKRVYATDRRA